MSMGINEEYDLFIDELLNRAIESFRLTEENKSKQKELDQLDKICKKRFSDEDYHFIMEFINHIMSIAGVEQRYLYHQGVKDGFSLIKKLESK